MKFKNRKGSALALTLMVFAVLMIFATFLLGFMVTENKQAINHQNKTQAYYIARSGAVAVENAIIGMNEEEIKNLNSKIEKGEVSVNEIDISGYKVNVTLSRESNKLIIKSLGNVKKVSKEVIKVMEMDTAPSKFYSITNAIFSNDNMIINGGTIIGDIGTNNNINITGWPTINGNGYLLDGKSLTSENKEWLKQLWPDTKNKTLNDKVINALPIIPNYFIETGVIKIPQFPSYDNYPKSLIKSLDLKFDENENIDGDKLYQNINIPNNRILYIDASKKDINIWTSELKIDNQIIVIGSYSVNIFIKSKFNTNSSTSPTQKENLNARVNIYFSGNGNDFKTENSSGTINANFYLNPVSNNININNAQIFGDIHVYNGKFTTSGGAKQPLIKGNIYSKNGNVEIPYGDIIGDIYVYNGNFTRISGDRIHGNLFVNSGDVFMGNGKIIGSIISRGSKINVSGSGKVAEGLVYAPNAEVNISGGGSIEGAVISNKFYMTGGGIITYSSKNIDSQLINVVNKSEESKNIYNPGYFK